MRRLIVLVTGLLLAISLTIIKPVCAEKQGEAQEQKEYLMPLQGVEFLSGFGKGDLELKRDYLVVPFLFALDFNLKPLIKKIKLNSPGLVQFQVEPFVGLVTQPKFNGEIGTSFLFKFGLVPETWALQPYAKSGVGMIYGSQGTIDQSTKFNFLINLGVGFHYFFNKNRSFTLEYRFRHASNASIKQPNDGIDLHFCLFGISQFF